MDKKSNFVELGSLDASQHRAYLAHAAHLGWCDAFSTIVLLISQVSQPGGEHR